MGPESEKQKQKLILCAAVFVAMGLVLAANVYFFQITAVYFAALAGVIPAAAGMVLAVLGMRRAVATDRTDRIEHTVQWFAANRLKLTAGKGEITDRERADSPFLSGHYTDCAIEIWGTLQGAELRIREMYIFDVVHTRKDPRSRSEVFYGTAVKFDCRWGKGDFILCSPQFHRAAVYRFDRMGYEKNTFGKNAPTLFVKTAGDSGEETLNRLYSAAQQLAGCLQSEDFALWYKDGTAEFFFCQIPPHINDIPRLTAQLQSLLAYL